jgi:hypothetical protein
MYGVVRPDVYVGHGKLMSSRNWTNGDTVVVTREPKYTATLPGINSIRVYLAARFSKKTEVKKLSGDLKRSGIVVTSRWLDEPVDENTGLNQVTTEYTERVALADVEDIDEAEFFVLFSENPESTWPRGGRHFETGYAYARGKRIIICGPKENVFHSLPGVVITPSWKETVDFLEFAQKRRYF